MGRNTKREYKKKDIPVTVKYEVTDPDHRNFSIGCQVYEVKY